MKSNNPLKNILSLLFMFGPIILFWYVDLNEFISNYNNMFEGKDSVGNPTHSEIKDNVVVIHYIDSDSFTVGDIETIIDDFLFQL